MEKTRQTSGADEKTPSKAEYFSWINNTNEGSTEAQTLINLDYFRYMRDTYGMRLDIYAWDAGNLDGSSGTYEYQGSPKLKTQYPEGYAPVAAAASKLGARMGVWCGADGFGDTKESRDKRYETIVSLCRDFGFGLFKIDTVCGQLREELRPTFKRMIDECRRYVPDLILLNHRNELGDAEICATTFLFEGAETYIDVHIQNKCTGPHHRMYPLERGLDEKMRRLTEDHGVCLSSCMDFFEDDLIVQAFSRSFILAPEIYGNPWLLRDEEQPALANVFTLHRKYGDILVSGMRLPESYGEFAVARGDGSVRFICLRNPTWRGQRITLKLDSEIGLERCGKVILLSKHPYEEYLGSFEYGDTVTVSVDAARSALFIAADEDKYLRDNFVLTGCAYETVVPDEKVRLVRRVKGEKIGVLGNADTKIPDGESFDATLHDPVRLASLSETKLPDDREALFEVSAFRADCDSFEYQSLKRAGKTAIPEVKAARDAFFAQKTYRYRGCENRAMFDGDSGTYFDGTSRYYGTRVDGGCLRIDFGAVYPVASLELEYFATDEPRLEVPEQLDPRFAEYSADLLSWKTAEFAQKSELRKETAQVVRYNVHNIEQNRGRRMVSRFDVGSDMRYFRLPDPMDRVYSVKIYGKDGGEIIPVFPHANNLLAAYSKKPVASASKASIALPAISAGDYLSVAINGVHGFEGAFCAAKLDGKLTGCIDRAPSYPVNQWEHLCRRADRFYTYYIPLDPSDSGKTAEIYALFCGSPVDSEVWLCHENRRKGGVMADIHKRLK